MPDGPGPIGDLAADGDEDGWPPPSPSGSERSHDFDERLSYHSEGQDLIDY